MNFQHNPKAYKREGYRQIVTEMWANGATQRQIAAHIGKSKNSVAGMIRFFNLPKKTEGRGVARGWTAKRINDAKPKPVPTIDPIGPINDFPGMGMCKFPYGNPGTGEDWRMCGHPAHVNQPWCDHHAARVYITRKAGAA